MSFTAFVKPEDNEAGTVSKPLLPLKTTGDGKNAKSTYVYTPRRSTTASTPVQERATQSPVSPMTIFDQPQQSPLTAAESFERTMIRSSFSPGMDTPHAQRHIPVYDEQTDITPASSSSGPSRIAWSTSTSSPSKVERISSYMDDFSFPDGDATGEGGERVYEDMGKRESVDMDLPSVLPQVDGEKRYGGSYW